PFKHVECDYRCLGNIGLGPVFRTKFEQMADPFLCGLLFSLRYALRVQINSDALRAIFFGGMNEDPSIAAAQVVYSVAFTDSSQFEHTLNNWHRHGHKRDGLL